MVMPAKPDEERATPVSLTLYPDELRELMKAVRERRISRSQLLREIVREWLQKRSQNNG